MGSGAELGTHRGDFAGAFLRKWKGEKLYLIDHYLPTRDYMTCRANDRVVAEGTLGVYKSRIEFLPHPTVEGLEKIDGKLDFIYVDAGHLDWEVAADIEAAWSKLNPGGMLAGHDYSWQSMGVCDVVNSFADKTGVQVWITQDTHEPWSWYCFKEGA